MHFDPPGCVPCPTLVILFVCEVLGLSPRYRLALAAVNAAGRSEFAQCQLRTAAVPGEAAFFFFFFVSGGAGVIKPRRGGRFLLLFFLHFFLPRR